MSGDAVADEERRAMIESIENNVASVAGNANNNNMTHRRPPSAAPPPPASSSSSQQANLAVPPVEEDIAQQIAELRRIMPAPVIERGERIELLLNNLPEPFEPSSQQFRFMVRELRQRKQREAMLRWGAVIVVMIFIGGMAAGWLL